MGIENCGMDVVGCSIYSHIDCRSGIYYLLDIGVVREIDQI